MGDPLGTLQSVLEQLLVLDALDRVRWALDNRPDRVADLVSNARATVRM